MAFDTTELEVAVDDVNLPGTGSPNKAEPLAAIKQIGWDFKQKPTCEEFNFLFNRIYQALVDLDSRTIVAGQLPVGSIYTNRVDSRNPSIILGYGTWTALPGTVIVGVGTYTDVNGEARVFPANSSGGEYSHTLTINEIPPHTHIMPFGSNETGGGSTRSSNNFIGNRATSSAGGGQPHNNIQPYITAYVWERIA